MKIDKDSLNAERLRKEWNALKKQPIQDIEAKDDIWNRLIQAQPSIAKAKVVPLRFKVYRWTAAAAAILLLVVSQFYLTIETNSNNLVEKTNNTDLPISIAFEDGSTVLLKPNSQLVYAEPFSVHERKVHLIGEARFDVSTDSLNPFIVETDGIKTKVLGTVFNVNAPLNHESTEILLFEGKVEVIPKGQKEDAPALVLLPGEKAEYIKSTHQLSKNLLVEKSQSKWKDGVILFKRADIDEVVITLEKWYDITITIDDKAKITETLVHRIDTNKMSLEEIVRGINLVAKYEIMKTDNDEYHISIKD